MVRAWSGSKKPVLSRVRVRKSASGARPWLGPEDMYSHQGGMTIRAPLGERDSAALVGGTSLRSSFMTLRATASGPKGPVSVFVPGVVELDPTVQTDLVGNLRVGEI